MWQAYLIYFFWHRWLYVTNFFFFCFILFVNQACALTFSLSNQEDIVGQVQWTQALPGDTFSKIGRRFDLGYFELVEANPMLNPEELMPGTIVVLPSRFILPPGPRKGIVVNLAELRIYCYAANGRQVATYPVGIGREGWDTPLGVSWVAEKIINPIWTVPVSIRKDREKEGVYLPAKVLPGPNNPLGGYALRLKQSTYLIHGTNDYRGVGRRSSAGCIRMLPEDIESFFPKVKQREPIYIVNLPYKLGWYNNRLYLEVHVPLQGDITLEAIAQAIKKKVRKDSRYEQLTVSWKMVNAVISQKQGIPRLIGFPA